MNYVINMNAIKTFAYHIQDLAELYSIYTLNL